MKTMLVWQLTLYNSVYRYLQHGLDVTIHACIYIYTGAHPGLFVLITTCNRELRMSAGCVGVQHIASFDPWPTNGLAAADHLIYLTNQSPAGSLYLDHCCVIGHWSCLIRLLRETESEASSESRRGDIGVTSESFLSKLARMVVMKVPGSCAGEKRVCLSCK